MSGKYRPSLSADEMELIIHWAQSDMIHCMQIGADTAQHTSILTRLQTALRKDAAYHTSGRKPGPVLGKAQLQKQLESYVELDADIASGKDEMTRAWEESMTSQADREEKIVQEINTKAATISDKEAYDLYMQTPHNRKHELAYSIQALAAYYNCTKNNKMPTQDTREHLLYSKGFTLSMMSPESRETFHNDNPMFDYEHIMEMSKREEENTSDE